MCTEAALSAIRRSVPEIYESNAKLLIDPKDISVTKHDFLASMNSMLMCFLYIVRFLTWHRNRFLY